MLIVNPMTITHIGCIAPQRRVLEEPRRTATSCHRRHIKHRNRLHLLLCNPIELYSANQTDKLHMHVRPIDIYIHRRPGEVPEFCLVWVSLLTAMRKNPLREASQ